MQYSSCWLGSTLGQITLSQRCLTGIHLTSPSTKTTRSRSWTGKSGCTSYRGLATIWLSCIMWENLLPLQKSIVWVWVGRVPFVRAIAARTIFSRKIMWCYLTWSAMVLSRIILFGSFTAKQSRVSPVHLNETLRHPRWWMKEDNNPHHQQQQRAAMVRMAITCWGKVLLCRERASDGGEIREATQLENQPRHEWLQVTRHLWVGACELVNIWCDFVNYVNMHECN